MFQVVAHLERGAGNVNRIVVKAYRNLKKLARATLLHALNVNVSLMRCI